MSSFRKLLTGYRLSGGSRTKGKWVDGGETPFDFYASIQPLKPKEMEMLPEGRRASGEAYRLYSTYGLKTVSDGENPDQVDIAGERFEVFSKDKWDNNVINHNKYIVTRLTDK